MSGLSRWQPTEVLHLELDAPLPDLPASGRGAAVVFWLRDVPFGAVDLAPSDLPMPAARLAALAVGAIAPAVASHLTGSRFVLPPTGAADDPAPVPPPALDPLLAADPLERAREAVDARRGVEPSTVSVVICTRDRPDDLLRCLDAIEALATKPLEVVVVDNAPSTEATARVAAGRPGIRYVLEPRPGLSAARNRGVAEAKGDVLAFTDDDAEVHPDWVARLAAGFCEPGVDVVTGLVLPASLDTDAQVLFERGLGGLGQGFTRRRFDRDWLQSSGTVWQVGAGANMAVRRSALERVGGFDERLGAGAAGCSEDSELWHRVLDADGVCRFEPAAVVFHHHRRTLAEVRRLSRDYLRGHVAALVVQARGTSHRRSTERLLVRLPYHYGRRAVRKALGRDHLPTLAPEVAGYVAGLRMVPGLLRRPRSPGGRADLGSFLAANPYPHPRTDGLYFREKMRAIHRIAPPGPLHSVLEVGGGRSSITRLLHPGATVVNLEIDPAARSSVVGDATTLPFDDARFDAVTFFDVLEHIPDDDAAVREALRVLRPGGWLLVTTPNQTWRFPSSRLLARVSPTDQDVMDDWGHVRRGYALSALESLVGWPAADWASFLSPAVAPGHDLGFSRLPGKVRRVVGAAAAPLGWAGYAAARKRGPGLEVAAAWQLRRP